MNKPTLQVDLADPRDILAKLPEAEAILAEKQRFAEDAIRDAKHWAGLVAKLKDFSITKVDEGTNRSSPVQDLVVHIVEREGRLMRPVEVAKILRGEGHEVTSNDAVNAALYAAVEAGRLSRPKQRHYGPKD